MILKRRTRQRSGIQRVSEKRFPAHRAWVRGHECAAKGRGKVECGGKIEAAHARRGTDGGLQVKPHDKWCIPLCARHHREVQHAFGEASFEADYRIDMKAIARDLAARSPHRKGWEGG